jgi:lysophospholipase L1-like esterase
MVNHVFNSINPGATSTDLVTMLIGTNDGFHYDSTEGSNTIADPYLDNFDSCFTAAVAWGATQSTQKYTGASFGSLPSNWSTDTTYSQVTGLQSTTNGAVSTWPFTTTITAQYLYVFYRIIDGNGGVFKIQNNAAYPALTNPLYVNAFRSVPIATHNGATQGVGVIVLQGNGVATSSSLTITVISPTGAGNIVSILAVAVAPAALTSTTPQVWATGPPRLENDELNQVYWQALYDHANADMNLLQRSGLAVHAVPIRNFMFSTASEMYTDGTHPNDHGYKELGTAFLHPGSLLPSRVNIPSISNLNQGAQYSDAILSSTRCPYYESPNEGDIIIAVGSSGACTVYLPTTAPIGNVRKIVNYSSVSTGVIVDTPNTTNIVQPIYPGQTVTVYMGLFGTVWQEIGRGPININTLLPGGNLALTGTIGASNLVASNTNTTAAMTIPNAWSFNPSSGWTATDATDLALVSASGGAQVQPHLTSNSSIYVLSGLAYGVTFTISTPGTGCAAQAALIATGTDTVYGPIHTAAGTYTDTIYAPPDSNGKMGFNVGSSPCTFNITSISIAQGTGGTVTGGTVNAGTLGIAGGTIITSQSSANSQVVTCVPESSTPTGDYCGANGVWQAPLNPATTPTVNHVLCVKTVGPPQVTGTCSTVVASDGSCTCS